MKVGDQQARQRLAEFILARRGELGLTQAAVSARGGPAPATQRLLENPQTALDANREGHWDDTLRKEERGLGLPDGSLRQLLGGHGPGLAAAPSLPDGISAAGIELLTWIHQAMLGEGRTPEEVRELAVRLGIPAKGDLTMTEWQEVARALGWPVMAVLESWFATQGLDPAVTRGAVEAGRRGRASRAGQDRAAG